MRLPALCLLLAAGLSLSCGGRDGQAVPAGAKRVVSFSPAITQMLWDMGLGDQVVGVTRLCELPPGQERTRVGDAFQPNTEAILAARPDVIFTQVDASKFRGVTDADGHVKVVYLRIESLEDIPAAMLEIGRQVGREDAAAAAAERFRRSVEQVRQSVRDLPRKRVLFVMSTDRPTVAADGTFVSDMIAAAGGVNAGADVPGLTIWRPTQIEAIIKARPDVLICQASADQESAARQYWMQWKDLPAAAAGQVYVVSDRDWSIPGPHLAGLLPKLAKMIHAAG